MSIFKHWKLDDYEVGFYAPSRGLSSASPMKIQIPKLMPLIPEGLPKVISGKSLSKGCYINSSECKPSVSSTYTTQNFLSVLQEEESDGFDYPIMHHGFEIQVSTYNDDEYYLRINHRLDPSVLI